MSELWLMSAATFRRLGKIEQAKGSIQEAEVKDESNPNVWVQVRFDSHPASSQQSIDFHSSLDFITLPWVITNTPSTPSKRHSLSRLMMSLPLFTFRDCI